MNKHVEGLRLLADALEASDLRGVSFPEQALGLGMHFRTQAACDAAEDALVGAGGVVHRIDVDGDDPLITVTFVSDARGSGWGGVRVTLSVHDDGEGDK